MAVEREMMTQTEIDIGHMADCIMMRLIVDAKVPTYLKLTFMGPHLPSWYRHHHHAIGC